MEKEILIEGRNLTKHFGGVTAIQDVDFELFQGEILGLIGPNGSGKTTLINLITGFLEPTDGVLFWKGKRVKNWSLEKSINEGIARTFQHNKIFSNLTVLENILLGQHRFRVRKLKILLSKRLGTADQCMKESLNEAAERILSFLNLKNQKSILAKNLPYGLMRLLGVGIALASNPEILFLDEPAVGMTPEETKGLMEIIMNIKESGITICLVDHNMKFIMNLSDRIVVLNQCRRIAEGIPEEIQQNEEVIRIYLRGTKIA
jgi:branched-chain amino acid transport system ATP-binding protein